MKESGRCAIYAKPYNTNMLKTYLSAKPSFLSAFTLDTISTLVHMRICSLVPKPKTTVIGLGDCTSKIARVDQQAVCILVDKAYKHHIGKALHSAAYL